MYRKFLILFVLVATMLQLNAQSKADISALARSIEPQVIEWRHHFHQNPELSNREFETAKYIAKHMEELGLEVHTGIAHTGVVAVLQGGQPGPTVGLRADIDALPVTERTPVPYASKVRTTYLGKETGVMHACGHDTHTAMLMGAAKILTGMKDQVKGKIVFVFQPAEEGSPPGEEGGAKLMVKEGLLDRFGIEVMFGQHIGSGSDLGTVQYRVGGLLAASDRFEIKVHGKQTHGSRPWGGVDPIVTAAQIVMGLQTIISRQTDLTRNAAVISVGKIEGGVRNNIIPEEVTLVGTIRTLDTAMQNLIHKKIRHTAEHIAAAQGATVEVDIFKYVPVTYNHPELTRRMIPTVFATAGEDKVQVIPAITGGEDFSYYANEIPSFFWFLGGKSLDTPASEAAPHHTPDFYIDDSSMRLGVELMVNVALDYADTGQ